MAAAAMQGTARTLGAFQGQGHNRGLGGIRI